MEQVIAGSGTRSQRLTNGRAVDGTLRRTELAGFLRARRASLAPSEVGILPYTARRRVKGLRREEVAEAAGISVAWYTWIEQARDLRISENTLNRLSRALRLSPQERVHMYRLAGHLDPLPQLGHMEDALSSVKAMIDSMNPNPSFALNPIWDIVVWNDAAEMVFGDLGKMPLQERNFVRMAFTSPTFRRMYVNWDEVARCTVAHFRIDSVSEVGDARWLQLIDDVNAQSAEFRQWWPRHDVVWAYSWKKELNHPHLGRTAYNSLELELNHPARLRIVTYIPIRPE